MGKLRAHYRAALDRAEMQLDHRRDVILDKLFPRLPHARFVLDSAAVVLGLCWTNLSRLGREADAAMSWGRVASAMLKSPLEISTAGTIFPIMPRVHEQLNCELN